MRGPGALQLLFRCARLAHERASRSSHELPLLKGSHSALLPHLRYEGVRVVELARRLAISKQAVSQTLSEMAEVGVVELGPDPSDGRAKLARLTPIGEAAIAQRRAMLEALEQELHEHLGEGGVRALASVLGALEAALER